MSPRSEWYKSSYSGQNGECVEVRQVAAAIGVRDSKDPAGGALAVSRVAWGDFVAAVRRGEFPLT
ncbi:DUF397 domain-containing protein [Streptomyces sp. MAR4 CNX-425]|uniref:DUF397 domain-containing protein n=1 Tax=Streptomyces sp. MAR4 CNX-425 TaxID=3406343 RepID=UPI003B50734B